MPPRAARGGTTLAKASHEPTGRRARPALPWDTLRGHAAPLARVDGKDPLEDLGALFAHPADPHGVWVLVLLCSAVTVSLAGIALVRGHLPAALASPALLLLPIFSYVLGDLKLLEASKSVAFCGSCHETMGPVVEAMRTDEDSLAGIHYRLGAVSWETACYQCHSGYGIWGGVNAKVAGFRHMAHTVTGRYEFPLEHRGDFDVNACLDCHAQAVGFREVASHRNPATQDALLTGAMKCAGMCHAPAHPPEALMGAAGVSP